jgi:hypothetical protein
MALDLSKLTREQKRELLASLEDLWPKPEPIRDLLGQWHPPTPEWLAEHVPNGFEHAWRHSVDGWSMAVLLLKNRLDPDGTVARLYLEARLAMWEEFGCPQAAAYTRQQLAGDLLAFDFSRYARESWDQADAKVELRDNGKRVDAVQATRGATLADVLRASVPMPAYESLTFGDPAEHALVDLINAAWRLLEKEEGVDEYQAALEQVPDPDPIELLAGLSDRPDDAWVSEHLPDGLQAAWERTVDGESLARLVLRARLDPEGSVAWEYAASWVKFWKVLGRRAEKHAMDQLFDEHIGFAGVDVVGYCMRLYEGTIGPYGDDADDETSWRDDLRRAALAKVVRAYVPSPSLAELFP